MQYLKSVSLRFLYTVASVLLFIGTYQADAQQRVTGELVNTSIESGLRYLRQAQAADGNFAGDPGSTALVALAMITAGESRESESLRRAIQALEAATVRTYGRDHDATYGISLQTMVFAALDPIKYRARIEENARWLETNQNENGSWGYPNRPGSGDPSNSQYALLGLNAAIEADVLIRPAVFEKARRYWESIQNEDGGYGYADSIKPKSYASMTAAGISSLVIAALRGKNHSETIDADGNIAGCGIHSEDPQLERAIKWLSEHFSVTENVGWNMNASFVGGSNLVWRFYYLYGLERAGRFTGIRTFGGHDWFYVGAEEILRRQLPNGSWPNEEAGTAHTSSEVTTSFAILFLAKGKSPVLISKLVYGNRGEWHNDADDAKNLVAAVAKKWNKHTKKVISLVWQTQAIEKASLESLERAPILFFNGHDEFNFSDEAVEKLRQYINRGGTLMADACCDRGKFDRSFRALMKRVFPEPELRLAPLHAAHPVWRMSDIISPGEYPLEGIDLGCRTVVIYSPKDLSCYWNQLERLGNNRSVQLARKVGLNIVDYFTGQEPPADKLTARVQKEKSSEIAIRGALQIGKLMHPGRWNAAPDAVPTMMALAKQQLGFSVVMNHRSLAPLDDVLINFPLVYLHGLDFFSYQKEEVEGFRKHFDPGQGSLLSDAACGSTAFDRGFRTLMKQLFPDSPLQPIPITDAIYTKAFGRDLSSVQYTPAMNYKKGYPELEGIPVNGDWAVVYSKYDLGCALSAAKENQTNHCKGYTYESAAKIVLNLIEYFTSASPGIGPDEGKQRK